MPSKIKQLIAVFLLGLLLRVWDLSGNPAGVYVDEAHLGYTAYSLLHTGKDSYGKSWPIMTKLFGSYSSALYSYLTVLPVGLMGLNIFTTRLLSAVSGSLLVLIAGIAFGPFTGLVIAVSPVFIFFSRAAFEANLALTLLIISLVLFFRSRLSLSALFLSLSAYAYHAEKLIAPIILIFFWGFYRSARKQLLVPVLIFVITQLPLWMVSLNPAVNQRFYELSYSGSLPEKTLTFINNYLGYLSPDNLFSRPDPDVQRSFPEISVFYWWMIIPAIMGLASKKPKLIFLTIFLSIIPGAVTRDYFSTIRVLPAFVGMAVLISYGLKSLFIRWPVPVVIIIIFSLLGLYSNLCLLKFERSSVWGYQYRQLAEFVGSHPDENVIIDNSRQKPLYILLAFYNRWPPSLLQSRYSASWLADYYSHPEFSSDADIRNISIRPIDWKKDATRSAFLIGDKLAISPDQISEHHLRLVTWVADLAGDPRLQILQTGY